MIRIRTVLIPLLAAAAAMFALAAPAAAATQAPPAPAAVTAVQTIQCQWIIGHSKWGGSWFEGRFSKNTCEEVLRGFAHCQEGRSLDIRTGGWAEPAGKWSQASCLPGWSLKGGGVDVKCETCSSYHRYWVTGDFPFDVPAAHYAGGTQASTVSLAKALRSCSYHWSNLTWNNYLIDFTFTQTCGKSLRAWGNWQNAGYHYGTYRKTPPGGAKHSVACGVPTTCGSGGGNLITGGYQVKSTGVMVCVIHCSAAIVKRYHLALAA